MIEYRGSCARVFRVVLFSITTFCASVLSLPSLAGDMVPTGGSYVAGSGTIATGVDGLNINQSSTTGIIDWSSFSIGSGNAVTFNNGAGATLNRVTSQTLSQIDGRLSATGSVYLINPNGIVIGSNGKVVTGGSFVASTRDLADPASLDGTMSFAGTGGGGVVNQGSITSSNGDVVLVGKFVNNTGAVSAPNGTAALAAGDQVVLRKEGSDGRISILAGTSGDVTNTGAIAAAAAELRAAGGNVYALAGNSDGIVRATSSATVGGHIWLTSNDGDVDVAGRLAATEADGTGGAVTMRGQNITASGDIDASATEAGRNGGDVSIVAVANTSFSGSIAARGGENARGGNVETSAAHLDIAGTAKVNTLAEKGVAGNWLIDPYDVMISADADTGAGFTATADDTVINVTTLTNALATSGVTVSTGAGGSQNGDITVAAPINWSADTVLALAAAGSININSAITASGDSAGFAMTYGAGKDYAFGSGGSLTLSGASATLGIGGNAYTLIHDVNALQDMNSDLAGYYALAGDIDASATSTWNSDGSGGYYGFLPVGNSVTGFTGSLAGLGHTISGLTINRPASDNIGLFGVTDYVTVIRDVGLVGGSVSGGQYTGALVGFDNGIIANSYATSNVSGSSWVGGLVGQKSSSRTISSSYATGSVSGDNEVGGLVGFVTYGDVINSYATGTVSGSSDGIGGLAGQIGYSVAIVDSYATGAVDGAAWVGGLVGLSYSGSIDSSYATGNVVGTGDRIGGLAGYVTDTTINASHAAGSVTGASSVGGLVGYTLSADISGSYATGDVTGTVSGAGGLVGENSASSSVDTSYASGSVSGVDDIGGLVGLNSNGPIATSYATGDVTASGVNAGGLVGLNKDSVSKAYATGSVTGTSGVGGLIGRNEPFGSLNYTYASGAVSGTSDVGGLVGYNSSHNGLYKSYFDIDTTGQTVGLGTDTIGYATTITGLTTAEARTQSSYSDFDFTTDWYMIDGETRPFLRSEYSTTIANAHQLQLMALDLTASYTLASDIDMTADFTADGSGNYASMWGASGFVPVGDSLSDYFSGGFDGQNHVITDLTIDRPTTDFVGLFGHAHNSGGMIGNLGLVGGSITGQNYVGTLVGYNYTSVSNVNTTGAVSGASFVGGLAGWQVSGTVDASSAAGAITATDHAGGLTGEASAGVTVSNAHATGDVTATGDAVGGLIGVTAGGVPVTSSYATGTVSGNAFVGGLIGSNNGSITTSFATGDVSGTDHLGGLAGYGDSLSDIEQSYATGSVTGMQIIGGLIGANEGGTVNQSYAVGSVNGAGTLGGLIGVNYGTVTDSFYDQTTTGQIDSGKGTGLTTAQMQSLSTYTGAGWDIDAAGGTSTLWRIYEGSTYPLLRQYFTGALTVTAGSGTKTYDGSVISTDVGMLTYNPSVYDSSLVFGTPVYIVISADAGSYSGSNLTLSGLYSSQFGYDINMNTGAGHLTIVSATPSLPSDLLVSSIIPHPVVPAWHLAGSEVGPGEGAGGFWSLPLLLEPLTLVYDEKSGRWLVLEGRAGRINRAAHIAHRLRSISNNESRWQ